MIHEHSSRSGIPQGTPISALLSNVYLLDFDSVMFAFVRALGGLYLRYCDDIMIVVPTGLAEGVAERGVDQLGVLKLEAHPDKTEKSRFSRQE